jgi:transcriptional regulator with XRE-family HTH domain
MDLAELIYNHRKKAGLSRIELASLALVGKSMIYNLEHGSTGVNFKGLLRVLNVLNIHLEAASPLLTQPTPITYGTNSDRLDA